MDNSQIDAIKPGEFTFCSRCGSNVHYGDKNFMCLACTSRLFSKSNISELEIVENDMAKRYERAISDIIAQHREGLADLRKEFHGR